MNITYTRNGDYLIPNIVIRKTKPIGHYEDFEMSADDRNCTGHFGVDTFCLALHGADLHIRFGAWSTKHDNCSAWRGCADYLFPAEWCDFAGYGIFD